MEIESQETTSKSQKKYSRLFYFALIILCFGSISFAWYVFNQRGSVESHKEQNAALIDTVTIYKTRDGKNGAYIRVVEGTKRDLEGILKLRIIHFQSL